MSKEFKINDWVVVTSLRKSGQLVGFERRGVAQVVVQGKRLSVSPSGLRHATAKEISANQIEKSMRRKRAARSSNQGAAKVDLYGMWVVDARKAVEQAINAALVAGVDRIEIVHGIGTGAVKKAVLEYLKQLPIPHTAKGDGLNPGVTWVYF